MRPTSEFYKPPKTTGQVLLGKFATLVRITKYGVPLPCYCGAIKEQVLNNFLRLVTHSAERILPKDTDSVKICFLRLPCPIIRSITRKDTDLLSERKSDDTLGAQRYQVTGIEHESKCKIQNKLIKTKTNNL
ncbi:hypothetical protein J6590_098190 [Homalodisca vitripennis]|nr:hypothetical protein J6590_098190 [Homalodisca vitripennis]